VTSGLPYGRTLADVEHAAQMAARYTVVDSISYADRYDEAWSAIVEDLYGSDHPPADSALIQAGRRGIFEMLRAHQQNHGYDQRAESPAVHASRAFHRFWLTAPTPSPENRIVEREALAQILPMLSPRQRQVVFAFAAFESVPQAAQSLGLGHDTFVTALNYARARFRLWWHEGEKPSKLWARNGRQRSVIDTADADVVRCSRRGHVFAGDNVYVSPRTGEKQCKPCRAERARTYRSRAKVGAQRG
jgi:DNA-directed RNA polymerase specialized sigma24 family protein